MPLSEAVRNTLAFLKMAAIELRRIAEQPSDITNDVLRVAEKLEDEAADMERRGFGAPNAEAQVLGRQRPTTAIAIEKRAPPSPAGLPPASCADRDVVADFGLSST